MEKSNFFQIVNTLPDIRPEVVFEIGGWPVTNSLMSGLAILLLFFILGVYINRNVRSPFVISGKVQVVLEIIYDSLTSLLNQITGDEELSRKILPMVGTILIFFVFANIMPSLPPFNFITINGNPLFRTHTNDFNTTFIIAAVAVLFVQYMSVQKYGLLNHLGKYIKVGEVISAVKNDPKKILESIVMVFIGLLDIIGELSRILSLSLRLFGNMFAADLLMTIFLSMFAVLLPSTWLLMGFLSGIIQAVVFGALTATYVSLAVQDE